MNKQIPNIKDIIANIQPPSSWKRMNAIKVIQTHNFEITKKATDLNKYFYCYECLTCGSVLLYNSTKSSGSNTLMLSKFDLNSNIDDYLDLSDYLVRVYSQYTHRLSCKIHLINKIMK